MNLREIDKRLTQCGWPEISPWWWNAYDTSRNVRNVVIRGGRRGGKSTTVCRIAVAEVLDEKHHVPPGDVGFYAIISATKEQAKERLQTCGKILTALNIEHKQTAEQILLADRPTGIRCFAATLKGAVSFTAVGALCDEVARWTDPDSGANPATEVLASLRPTMATMPHAQMWLVSSPWSTLDAHHKAVALGDTPAQKVFSGATWEMNPSLTESDTLALEPDYATWQREYAAQPMASDETRFFPASFIDLATARKPAISFQEFTHDGVRISRVVAGADFAFRRNSSTMVAIKEYANRMYRLVAAEERIPGALPLVPSKTISDLAGIALACGAEAIATDLHYVETVREVVETLDIGLLEYPTTSQGNAAAYVKTRILLSEDRLDLSLAPPRLIEQLKETTGQPTAEGGLTIKNKTKGDAHGDLVSALVCAVWALDQDATGEKLATGMRRYVRGGSSEESEIDGMPPESWRD